MGRPKNPLTPFKVSSFHDKQYHYAYIQPPIEDAETGKITRRKLILGSLDRDLKVIPSVRFRLMDIQTRKRLIWPENWDITEVNKLNQRDLPNSDSLPADSSSNTDAQISTPASNSAPASLPVSEQTIEAATMQSHNESSEESAITVSSDSTSCQYDLKIYGAFWYLEQLAQKKQLEEDLLEVFHGDIALVDDLFTLAFYPILTRNSYNRLARWQRIAKTRSEFEMSESYITKFVQRITNKHRSRFIELRIKRQPTGAFAACDSTTKSGYGKCLVDLRWGKNKDRDDLPCTSLVVVYSLSTHEPVYYRRFPGNTNDSSVIRTIQSELKEYGVTDLVFITDRGFTCVDNMALLFTAGTPFLMCTRVETTPVIQCLMRIGYDADGLPKSIPYYKEHDLYCAQFDADVFTGQLEDGTKVNLSGIKVNAYLNINRRMHELQRIREHVEEDDTYVQNFSSIRPVPSIDAARKKLKWYNVKQDKKTKEISFVRREDAILKAKAAAGYFASCMWNYGSKNAIEVYEDYKLRNEQEEYFSWDKQQNGQNGDMQMAYTEESIIGRDFIRFVGLIPFSELKHLWKTTELRTFYDSTLAILDEMAPIRYSENTRNDSHITTFTSQQVSICDYSGIKPPPEVMTSRAKQAWQQKHEPKPRGRKSGRGNTSKA